MSKLLNMRALYCTLSKPSSGLRFVIWYLSTPVCSLSWTQSKVFSKGFLQCFGYRCLVQIQTLSWNLSPCLAVTAFHKLHKLCSIYPICFRDLFVKHNFKTISKQDARLHNIALFVQPGPGGKARPRGLAAVTAQAGAGVRTQWQSGHQSARGRQRGSITTRSEQTSTRRYSDI